MAEKVSARGLVERVARLLGECGECSLVNIIDFSEKVLRPELNKMVPRNGKAYIHPWYADPWRRNEIFMEQIPEYEPLIVEVLPPGRIYVVVPGSPALMEIGREELSQALRLLQHLLGPRRLSDLYAGLYNNINIEGIVGGILLERQLSKNDIGYIVLLGMQPFDADVFRSWYIMCKSRGKVAAVDIGNGRKVVLTNEECIRELSSRGNYILYYDVYPFNNLDDESRELLMKYITAAPLRMKVVYRRDELVKLLGQPRLAAEKTVQAGASPVPS